MSKLVAGGDLGSSVNLPTTTTSPTHHQYHHHHQLALVHRGEATTSASADSSLGRPPSRRTDIASLAHSLTNIAQQLSPHHVTQQLLPPHHVTRQQLSPQHHVTSQLSLQQLLVLTAVAKISAAGCHYYLKSR